MPFLPTARSRFAARVAAGLAVALLTAGCGTSGSSPLPPGAATATPASATPAPEWSTTPIPSLTPAPTAAPATTPAATPIATLATSPVALVPVVRFWDVRRTISRGDVAVAISGLSGEGPARLPLAVAAGAADAGALSALLRVPLRNVRTMAPDAVAAYVKATPGALGILRAGDVGLGVRALAVDGRSLFGTGRVRDLAEWPLLVNEPGTPASFDPAAEWTLAAGGDVMLDKAVYAQSVLLGRGVDYAWDGARAVVDRRTCCGWGGGRLAAGHAFGNPGQVAALFRNADVAAVNLESPEPTNFRYHSTGYTFTGDPALLQGLANAGIDVVSMANNHLGDGGLQAVAQESASLDALGIAHAGAGANLSAARRPALLTAGGRKIAFLAYCWIDPVGYWATSSSPGSSGYTINHVVSDIKAAKQAGADIVVVMPHWGIEYTDDVYPQQRKDAQRMIAAGADLILGSHSHWFGQMQQVGQKLVFYSFGDLVFDWTHDERTQESAIADLSFVGDRLVQVDLLPTFIIAGQPNLLDPAGDGRRLFDQLERNSEGYLGW